MLVRLVRDDLFAVAMVVVKTGISHYASWFDSWRITEIEEAIGTDFT